MNKSILFILFFLISQIAFSQKVVVGLHNINTIYAGIKNPIDIAMDGYTFDKFKTTTTGCDLIIDTTIKQYYLTADKEGLCKVNLTFKKVNKIKLDTLIFKIKNLPKPESLFGELESGSYSIQELIDQNLLNAIIPNFYIDGYEYTVTNYSTMYVPKRGEAMIFKSLKNQIPFELKFRIMTGKNGDKILMDDIMSERLDGKKRRLAPIVMTITNDYEEPNSIEYDFQNVEIDDSSLKINFNNDPWNIYKSGITRGYLKSGVDSQLVFELKKNGNKILWEKHFYPSGKPKAEYNFVANDSLGEAISYYENGKLKSKGQILPKSKNIYNYYRIDISYGHCYMDYDKMHFMDSFFLLNYVPYGHWVCYSPTGNILMDCNLALFNHGKMPMGKNDSAFDISNHNPNWEKATINTTLNNKDCYFKVGFDSVFKTFNHIGQLTEMEYYNYKPKIPKSYRRYYYSGDITHNEIVEYNEYYDDGKQFRKFTKDLETGEEIEKLFYENGQLKEETNFKNSIEGQFKSFYSNGYKKVEGKVIKNVFRLDRDRRDTIKGMDSINIISNEKIGEWKSYNPNGTIAFVCTFKLFGWTDLKQELKFFEDMENNYPQTDVLDETVNLTKQYLPDDVINYPDNKFYSKLAGLCYFYDDRGKLIKIIDFKN